MSSTPALLYMEVCQEREQHTCSTPALLYMEVCQERSAKSYKCSSWLSVLLVATRFSCTATIYEGCSIADQCMPSSLDQSEEQTQWNDDTVRQSVEPANMLLLTASAHQAKRCLLSGWLHEPSMQVKPHRLWHILHKVYKRTERYIPEPVPHTLLEPV